MRTIVVGVSGGPESLDALRWAQELARRLGADVRAVRVFAVPIDSAAGDFGTVDASIYLYEQVHDAAQKALDDAVGQVPADGVERTTEVVLGVSQGGALVQAVGEDDLLVLGSRRHKGLERALGTTAIQCVQHSPSPVVIVPHGAPALGGTIAVAFDGSDHSQAALQWAARVANKQGLVLRVISVWERAVRSAMNALVEHDPISPEDHAVAGLRAAVEAVVLDVRPDIEYVAVEASGKVAPHVLEAAEGATLLVLGSRGRGGFRGLLLGSVSQRCLESAELPVAIVR